MAVEFWGDSPYWDDHVDRGMFKGLLGMQATVCAMLVHVVFKDSHALSEED